MSRTLASAVLAILAPVALAHVEIVYVDRDATGSGAGTSWTNAIPDLQDGLAKAIELSTTLDVYVQIWVADGTYTPAGPAGPRTESFVLHNRVGLYGGFAGGEQTFSARDPVAHPAILSGDLQGDDLPNWVNHANNAYHVVTSADQGTAAVLDGFTVRGGYANDAFGGHSSGAGLRSIGSPPAIARCIFTGNFANSGGAVSMSGGTLPASIVDCTFTGNLAQPSRGGALHLSGGAGLLVEGSRFVGNQAVGFGSPSDAGAIWIDPATPMTIRACEFLNNTTTNTAVNMDNGGAICSLSDQLVLEACTFAGNHAEVGGAVWNGGESVIVNCIFSGNEAEVGGGLFNFFSSPDVLGCTFASNVAGEGGGMANSATPLVHVRDCVLWGNIALGQPTLWAQIHNLGSAKAEILWSDVQALFETIPGEDPPDPADFPGCIDADPLFIDADGADGLAGTLDDDLRLGPGSPARDAGRNDHLPATAAADVAGASRFWDDPAAPDTGFGTAPFVDMGAHEGSAPVVWSVAGSGLPGGTGVPVLRAWGTLNPGSPGAIALEGGSGPLPAYVVLSSGVRPVPFKGGILAANPIGSLIVVSLDSFGSLSLPWPAWPAGSSGLVLGIQAIVSDPSAIKFGLSNAVVGTVP